MWARLPGIRAHALHPGRRAARARSAARAPACSSPLVARPLPRDQRCRPGRSSGAAYSTSVGQRRHRAGQHRVVALPPLRRAPSPRRARRRRARSPRPRRAGRLLHELALAACRTRPGRPRRPGRAIAIGRPGKPAPLPMSTIRRAPRGLEPGQRARGCRRRARRRPRPGPAPRWRRAGRRAGASAARPAGRRVRARATTAGAERLQARRPRHSPASRFTFYAEPGRSGVITIRRKGSSPSQCVSTSGRSFR